MVYKPFRFRFWEPKISSDWVDVSSSKQNWRHWISLLYPFPSYFVARHIYQFVFNHLVGINGCLALYCLMDPPLQKVTLDYKKTIWIIPITCGLCKTTRASLVLVDKGGPFDGGRSWIWTNAGRSQRIYSPPLLTRLRHSPIYGGISRIRTWDAQIFSLSLYQLS